MGRIKGRQWVGLRRSLTGQQQAFIVGAQIARQRTFAAAGALEVGQDDFDFGPGASGEITCYQEGPYGRV